MGHDKMRDHEPRTNMGVESSNTHVLRPVVKLLGATFKNTIVFDMKM